MDTESLLALVRYHVWANERILTAAAGLSDAELRRPAPLDHGNIFETLRHLVDVGWSWREICIGNDVGQTYAASSLPSRIHSQDAAARPC